MADPSAKRLKMSEPPRSINETFPDEILVKILVEHLCTYSNAFPHQKWTTKLFVAGRESISDGAKRVTITLGVLLASSVCRRWRGIVLQHVGANNIWSVGPTEYSKGVDGFESQLVVRVAINCAYFGNETILGQILNHADESWWHQLFIHPIFHRALGHGRNTAMLKRVMERFAPTFLGSSLALYLCLKTAVRCNQGAFALWVCTHFTSLLDDPNGHRDGDAKIQHILKNRVFRYTRPDLGPTRKRWTKNVVMYLALKYQKIDIVRSWKDLGLFRHIFSRPRSLTGPIHRAIRHGNVRFLVDILELSDRPNLVYFRQIMDLSREQLASMTAAFESRSVEMGRFVFSALWGGGEYSDTDTNILEPLTVADLKAAPMFGLYLGKAPPSVIKIFLKHFPTYCFGETDQAMMMLDAISMGDAKKARWVGANWPCSMQILGRRAETSIMFIFSKTRPPIAILEYIYRECGVPLNLAMCEVMMSYPDTMEWVYAEWRKQPEFEAKRTGFENAFIRGTDNGDPLCYVATLRDMECARMFLDMFPEFLERKRSQITTVAACYNNLNLLRMLKDRYGPFIKILRCREDGPFFRSIGLGTLKWLHAQRECVWAPGWITSSDYISMDAPTQYWLKERYKEIPGIADIITKMPPTRRKSQPNSYGTQPTGLTPYCGHV